MDSQRNMSEISRQLNLDMGTTRTSFVPKTISDILTDLSLIHDFSLKSSKLDFHIHLLEEELRKIDAFKRELPYCMQILQDAIETLKEELFRLREIEEEPMLVTEEFMPHLQSDERVQEKNDRGEESSHDLRVKKKWMSHFRLWNTPVHFSGDANEPFSFKSSPSRGGVAPLKRSFGVMKTARDDEKRSVDRIEETSLRGSVEPLNAGDSAKPFKQHKKQRRCWSSQLHLEFSKALQQLGGSHKATPKQIRDLMKVNGLTNDEVKSHLQKYRLHLKKKAQQKLSSGSGVQMHFNGECSAARGGADENEVGKAVLYD